MSVHDIFFLPGDEDSILHQGVEGAAEIPKCLGATALLVVNKDQQQDPG